MHKPKNSINDRNLNKSENINYFNFLNNDDDCDMDDIHSTSLKNVSKQSFTQANKKNDKILKNYVEDTHFDNGSGKWQPVGNKKKTKIVKPKNYSNLVVRNEDEDKDNIVDDTHFNISIEKITKPSDDGSSYKLFNNWNIWTHTSESNNWTPESYKNIFTIDSLKTFWEFFGNIDKLDLVKHQFYIMRESSGPTWEHPSNRSGGICSIRVIKDRSIELIEQLAILVLNECFSDKPSDINGLSFSIKHNWGVIKIWNGTGNNDVSTHVPMYMQKKYSVNPRYEINEPEY
ncbi:translation initiation factor 4E [Catovirus CTV1]|uniref:Translation initiation factor 4E n=1 Tax=Catovirus CTV1 TaxID=1977631 RepID=A0A1V0SBH8_9VIRU|nr:translation initiation factor 4E [Catovirus CTV1]